ncbi:MAG: DUF3810 domain-containing protein [Gracilibacteraceae bacterium]|nr:DUF3810 domain-containing protein [Gracilibacteraceae bacterium]
MNQRPGARRGPRAAVCFIPLALSAALLAAARSSPAWAEWYAGHIYPVFPYTIGRLCALFPFSLFEFLLLALGAGALLLTGWTLLALTGPAAERGTGRLLFRVCAALSAALLIFTLTGGVNYSRETFAARYSLQIRESSPEELRALYRELAAEAGEALAALEPAAEERATGRETEDEARRAMAALGRRYSLISYYPPPKPVLFSSAMSWLGISGIFSPFTLEANYNSDMPDFQIPCAICHELAHVSGYMREDEAGFISYLACRASPEAAFRYSGAMFALSHVLNALGGVVSPEEYGALYAELPAAAAADFRRAGEYWRRFAGRAADIQTRANDAYLRANAQENGVRGYGQVVDLLLAWRRAEQ